MTKVYKVFYKDGTGKGNTHTVNGQYGVVVLVQRLNALGYTPTVRRVK